MNIVNFVPSKAVVGVDAMQAAVDTRQPLFLVCGPYPSIRTVHTDNMKLVEDNIGIRAVDDFNCHNEFYLGDYGVTYQSGAGNHVFTSEVAALEYHELLMTDPKIIAARKAWDLRCNVFDDWLDSYTDDHLDYEEDNRYDYF